MLTAEIHQLATRSAELATIEYIEEYGEHPGNCGFAWVSAGVKGNTKVGKSYIAQGFNKDYVGGYKLWNPGKSFTQDMSAKYAGAKAYVNTVKAYIPDAPLYANYRLD